MAQAGATAPAVNSQGSCARGEGSVRAQTEVQVRTRMRRAEALAAQSCRAQLRQWRPAVAEAGRLWERRRQWLGDSWLRLELGEARRYEVTFCPSPPRFK